MTEYEEKKEDLEKKLSKLKEMVDSSNYIVFYSGAGSSFLFY